MRILALGLLLVVAAGCGGGNDATVMPARRVSCASLARALVHLAPPRTMPAQRRALARLARAQRALRTRFGVDARAAVQELSAALRAEHESVSARIDGRVTASRRLHAGASVRYARGAALARTAGAACP